MATKIEDSPVSPQVVGNAFVQQYYSLLNESPELVFRFYNESSVLSRPEPDGDMKSVTTLQGINDKIVSLNYKNFHVEILSADAQLSYKDGVMVVVTGSLTGEDNAKRMFTQAFFLAPQDKGYFVLNDVFRYIDEHKPVMVDSAPANDVDESAPAAPADDVDVSAPATPVSPDPEPKNVQDSATADQTPTVDTDTIVSKEVSHPLENAKISVTEKGIPDSPAKDSSQQDLKPNTDKTASNIPEDTPKKSFASVVHALKDNAAPFHMRISPAKPVEQERLSAIPTPEVQAPISNTMMEKNNDHAGKAYAIFVANLPMSATVEQLERVFKKFGSIKRDGIQVRSNKGSCFGFVEFESASSMTSALEASSITLDNRRLSIEERRANYDRVRLGSGGGGFRNEGYRGRGNFGGGSGYERNDFEKRGNFSGRARGNAGRNGEKFPRAYQDQGRVPRQGQAVKVQ
ncbi:Ras GTPase-activating protein-binding protein 2-like [Quillaja saponaria]|uniref:Ras GTPase-activating protein-binding protein 2-like n=1 Tax=Quillaja saponaria TaxID=32244 RepID=A0AAD7LAT7_QUISA|nr:Ras GTPase-activating protein-binding protein 2-like [Quillaja saponaria]